MPDQPQAMQLVDTLDSEVPMCDVVAIGNFDGVHRGHQVLLQKACELARASTHQRCDINDSSQGRVGVVSFAPLPVEVLFPERAPGRVGSDNMRNQWLADYGMDVAWIVPFTKAFAQWTPDDFVARLLVEKLRVRHVVVGSDFHYGHQRAGDIDSLRAAGREYGFSVHAIDAVVDADNQRISSTNVRQALQVGDMHTAQHLLGRPYDICGEIVNGRQLGRQLGYPTANIRVGNWRCLLTGVYAIRARFIPALAVSGQIAHNRTLSTDDQPETAWLTGVASIGYRPTVTTSETAPEHLLEVHLFDYSQDCYGRTLQVQFIRKLRDEARFDNIDNMVEQMHVDARQARDILG